MRNQRHHIRIARGAQQLENQPADGHRCDAPAGQCGLGAALSLIAAPAQMAGRALASTSPCDSSCAPGLKNGGWADSALSARVAHRRQTVAGRSTLSECW